MTFVKLQESIIRNRNSAREKSIGIMIYVLFEQLEQHLE